MLFIIGLGLNEKGISKEGMEAVKKCGKVYLENYTVDFPYSIGELKKVLGKKIVPADREFVEGMKFLSEAKKEDVALLVYGSPLIATTHISIIDEAKKRKIKTEIIHGASILDAVAGTGLQIYKFGKIASIPKWDKEKNFAPDSFVEILKQNLSIDAHTLFLCDIGLEFSDAFNQLEVSMKKHGIKEEKIIVCSRLGAKRARIFYREFSDAGKIKGIEKPFCIAIPGKLHFAEKEFLESLG